MFIFKHLLPALLCFVCNFIFQSRHCSADKMRITLRQCLATSKLWYMPWVYCDGLLPLLVSDHGHEWDGWEVQGKQERRRPQQADCWGWGRRSPAWRPASQVRPILYQDENVHSNVDHLSWVNVQLYYLLEILCFRGTLGYGATGIDLSGKGS